MKNLDRSAIALFAALVFFAHSPPSLAAVYKCTGADGKVTYGDQPCEANEQSQQVTITPAPRMNSSPNAPTTPAGTQSLPVQNHQAEVQACTAKAFGDWQRAMGSNLPSPHTQIEKLRQFRNQCIRQSNQSGSATTPMTRVTSQPVSAPVQQAPLPPAPGGASAGNRDPAAVLNALADRIYVIGETTGKGADMIAAEAAAADEIRHYLSSGSTDGLLAKEKGKQSSLETAAYLGYPNVVAALLTSKVVIAHINDADDTGLTPWIAATISMKQSLWSCNPTIWDDPFRFVPLMVSQPYYILNPTPPYAKTRELLEKAGATADPPKAKELWLTLCKAQSAEDRAKVQASTNLQDTVQKLGAVDLATKALELQKKAQAQKKPSS